MATGFIYIVIFLHLISSSYTNPDNITWMQRNSSGKTNKTNNSRSSSHEKIVESNPSIIFRDSEEKDDKPYHKIHTRMPSNVIGAKKNCVENICEDVDDYPDEYIKNMLKVNSKFDDYFKTIPFSILDRNNFAEDDETLCQTRSHITYPKTAINFNKTERLIVNVDDYKQALVFETCTDKTACKFSEMFPNDYETVCKQRYVIRRLIALNDEKKPAFDTFEVPSCCVCTYKKRNN